MKASLWVTWEDHRRSRELAKLFGADYQFIPFTGKRFLRYPVLFFKTFLLLKNKKAEIIFCQNPSLFLAVFLCLNKLIFKYYLVVDRHSSFKFSSRDSWLPKWKIFHFLSDWSLKNADMTIVTNNYLKDFIESLGGKSFVLPDAIPNLQYAKDFEKNDSIGKLITFISTYSDDEPIFEIIQAAELLGDGFTICITGSYKNYKYKDDVLARKPANVVLTGFLPEETYQKQLASSDVIMVITTQEYTLTCGAYEAVSLCKPMVLGDTKTIKSYFNRGARYTKPKSLDISNSIKDLFSDIETYKDQVSELKEDLIKDWNSKFQDFESILNSSGKND